MLIHSDQITDSHIQAFFGHDVYHFEVLLVFSRALVFPDFGDTHVLLLWTYLFLYLLRRRLNFVEVCLLDRQRLLYRLLLAFSIQLRLGFFFLLLLAFFLIHIISVEPPCIEHLLL